MERVIQRSISTYVDQNGVISFGYTHNVAGMTSYTNQLGKVTRYEYHAAGWKTKEVYVGVSTNSFDYSPSGRFATAAGRK